MNKKELEIVKEAGRRSEWYKRGGVFKEAYDILAKATEPKAKTKSTKKKTSKKGK